MPTQKWSAVWPFLMMVYDQSHKYPDVIQLALSSEIQNFDHSEGMFTLFEHCNTIGIVI
jgi:hypothetical protein